MSEPAAVIAPEAGSAPASTEVENKPAETPESGTGEQVEVNEDGTPKTPEGGSEPLGEKGKDELIKLRKRAQNAEAMVEFFRNQQTQSPAQPQFQPPQQTQPVPPKEEDFQSWEEFHRAELAYGIEVAKHDLRKEFSEQSMRGAAAKSEVTWMERLQKEAADDPTILEAMKDDTLPITPFAASMIKESEIGPKILKYLDNNRADAIRLAGLSPVFAAMELGRIKAEIMAAPAPTPPKRISQAPEPIKPVTPAGTTVVDENNLSTEEWIRRRNEQEFSRAKK